MIVLIKMKPYAQRQSDHTELMIRSDTILTIAGPTIAVIDRYVEMTS